MSPEEALRGGTGPAGLFGCRADEHRSGSGGRHHVPVHRRVGLDDIGDDTGDVVAAAGLERGTNQFDRGEVDGAAAEDVGQPVVVEHPGRAVAAEQDPVAGRELDHEEVGVGLVHPVDRAQDQVAVRVDPGLVLGDPSLVDQALHERVVLGELADHAVAEQVAATVTDVPDAQLGAVEERRGDRRTRALELRVLVDQLGDPVVRPVDRSREGLEHVVGRRYVESAQNLYGGAAGDIAASRATDPVRDDQESFAREAGVLVVLSHSAHVGERGVPEAQWCRGHRQAALFPQLEGGLSDANLRTELKRRRLREPLRTDIGAVRGPEVLHEPLLVRHRDPGMPGGDVVVVEADRRIAAATDQEWCIVERDPLAGISPVDDRDVGRGSPGTLGRLRPVLGGLPLRLPLCAWRGVDAGTEHVRTHDGDRGEHEDPQNRQVGKADQHQGELRHATRLPVARCGGSSSWCSRS